MTQRKIIHVDMDCFYAAIEIRDNPALVGKPVAVGGDENSRGVLCTCNYEARKYGIHSAMPSSKAKRLCPDLIIVPVNFDKYRASSKNIQQIFHNYTNLVEPLSLDEAYLDVSDSKLFSGSATLIAKQIRQDIFDKEAITASAGISYNKLLAKISSDWNKPNGQFVITPSQSQDFVQSLPLKKLFGVGQVTAEKLNNHQLHTCGDVQKRSIHEMISLFGLYGQQLYNMAHGIDERAVSTERIRKSLSVEETFYSDIVATKIPDVIFDKLFQEMMNRLNKLKNESKKNIKSIFVKIKFGDFTSTTIQSPALDISIEAFKKLYRIRANETDKSVRLIGFGVHFGVKDKLENSSQLSFKFLEK